MLRIEPMIHEIANGIIDMMFMENFHGYENITVRLFKLPINEAAAEIRNNLAVDIIINHILTKRIKKLEQCEPILQCLKFE